jgi:phage protein D
MALTSARPSIAVAGQDRPALAGALRSLRIEERLDGLFSCELTFGNWGAVDGSVGFLYFDRRLLDFGKTLKVSLGSDALFDGRISALEATYPDAAPPVLTVLAEDRLQDLRMTRRTRTFTDLSDGDAVRRIASDHGLTPDVDLPGPTHKVLAQLDQSDLAFLRDRARAIGAEVWVQGATLAAKSRTSRRGAALTLDYGGGLRELDVSADLAHQRTAVEVGGWDVAGKQALKERVTDTSVSGEVAGGDSGAGVLAAAFGGRTESVADAVPLTSAEARARAEALFRQRARRFLTGDGVAQTSAALRVGATVTLRRLGPLFDGAYHVTRVRHLFDGAAGLRTEFTGERPAIGRP